MTNDKYETFKKWFEENPVLLPKEMKDGNLIFYTQNIFENFEKEQEEKNREKEIKNKIFDTIKKEPIPVTDLYGKIGYGVAYLTEDVVDRIYDKLKEGGYLK